VGKRSSYVEDGNLTDLSRSQLEFELSVWTGRAALAANAYQRKSAERRIHLIDKALALHVYDANSQSGR